MPQNKNKKNFIFLQGPIGPFFNLLSKELRILGHNVITVNFWGGDYINNPNGINYQGNLEEWSKFFSSLCIKNKITDIVLFGDRRSYHEKAIETVAQLNSETNVWVFEEGYLRPNWVTLDKYGANLRTSINIDNDKKDNIYHSNNTNFVVLNSWIKEAIPEILKYYAAGLITKPFMFNNFKYHRLQHPLIEMSGWILKWGATFLKIKDDDVKVLKANSKLQNHFVVALQLETDAQIRMYSPFKSMKEFMYYTMKSFKEHAPQNTNLIIKTHPFDEKWFIREYDFKKISKELEIEERTAFIDTCNASTYLNNAIGLITANSSLSLYALENNIPVIALGQAFWDIEGITNKKDLNLFWKNPTPPNFEKFKNLKNEIIKTQINGNFYSKEGRSILIPKAIEHILNEKQDTHLLTEKVLKRIKENNQNRINQKIHYIPKKLDLKV